MAWLKGITIIGSLFILTFFGIASLWQITGYPGFCSKCHEMYPYYATWAQSAHNKITCDECHTTPGVKNLAQFKISLLNRAYAHISGNVSLPITLSEDITNQTCLKCHTRNRKITPAGDLVMPHYEHIDKEMNCIKCHQGLVHGILDSGEKVKDKKDLQPQNWTTVKVKQLMEVDLRPKMDLCMKCHALRQVTLDCKACHAASKKPDSHNQPGFASGHSQLAAKSLKDCDFCHGYGEKKIVVNQPQLDVNTTSDAGKPKSIFDIPKGEVEINNSTSIDKPNVNSLQEYIQENGFCFNCHTKKPASHNGNWRKIHGSAALDDQSKCMYCHAVVPDGRDVKPAITYCARCHPAEHKPAKTIKHPFPITGKSYGPECQKCHSNICLNCHS